MARDPYVTDIGLNGLLKTSCPTRAAARIGEMAAWVISYAW
jgi:hypothetical protein